MISTLEFIWLAPRNLLIAFVLGWRRWISPLYGDVCRYYPSCSAYGLAQLQRRGLILGIPLTVFRIIRCNPWARGGVDEVKIGSSHFRLTKAGFVLPKKGK